MTIADYRWQRTVQRSAAVVETGLKRDTNQCAYKE